MRIKDQLHKLLRWVETYAKIDIMYVVKGNFWLNINRLLSIANGLILSVAFAYLLTREDYGTYSFALIILGLFSMPHTTALGAGIVKGAPQGNHALVLEGLKIIFPWSLGSALLLAVTAGYYFIMGNIVLATSFFVGAIFLPALIKNGIAKSFISAKGDFGVLARFNIIRTPFMTAALVLAALLFHNALSVIVVSIIGNTLLSSSLYIYMSKRYDLNQRINPDQKFAKSYAFHSALLSILGYLSEKMDSILLWKFLGAAPVAVYNYALAPVRELRSLIENQSALAIPKFAQRDFNSVRKTVLIRIKQLYFLAVPLTILYVIAAPYLFSFLFPQYMDAVFISQLAALSLLTAPRKLMNAAIAAHQRVRESYLIMLLPNLLRLLAVSVLVPIYGTIGAVAALLVTEFLEYIILGVLLSRGK